MRFYKNKIVFAVVITFFCSSVFSQKNTDGNFLFKTWIYLEHINNGVPSRNSEEISIKDSAFFSLFMNNIILRLDTLKSNGFSDDYIFLAINFKSQKERAEGKDSSLLYAKTKFLGYIGVPSLCNRYVLCVNKATGFSYRLQGFTGNDFLNLLKDVKEEYNLRYKKQLKTKTFFKEYFASDIDFGCIYKGLQSGQYDSNKYPCLYNCRGSNEIIWTQ